METYQLPLPEKWEDTNVKSLEFVLHKAEVRLGDTVQYFNRLYSRIFTYIGMLTPVVAALVYGLYQKALDGGILSGEPVWLWIGVPVLIMALYSLWLLTSAQRTYGVHNPGAPPKELALPYYLGHSEAYPLDEQGQYLAMLIGYTSSVQMGIETNETTCAELQQTLTRVIYLMLFTLLASVLILALVAVVFPLG